jgi:hypothetical protein
MLVTTDKERVGSNNGPALYEELCCQPGRNGLDSCVSSNKVSASGISASAA